MIEVDTDECIEWDMALNNRGYGIRWDPKLKKLRTAHRMAYEETNGPIPEGLCVLHRCDNPPCFNVDHLFLGTHADNAADKVAKGRARGPSKLTREQVLEIKSAPVSSRAMARSFGVSYKTVKRIRRGEWYTYVS